MVAYSCEEPQLRCRAAPWGGQGGASPAPTSLIQQPVPGGTMSLRKSPQLTPALLAAARQNAQHSTGPRSAAAKQNVKFNSLKHGGRVSDENRREVENRNSKTENRD